MTKHLKMENEIEDKTSKNDEGKENPNKPGSEKTGEEKSKELESLNAQKQHWREKAEKAEAELAKFKGEEKKEELKVGFPQASPMEIVRLAKTLGDYDDEEVQFIIRNSKENSVDSIIGASKDEWVQAAIKAKREKVDKESKRPEPNPPVVTQDGKTIEDIAKIEDDKEFIRTANKIMQKNLNKRRGI